MDVHTQVSDYLAAQPARKRADMQALHSMMLSLIPDARSRPPPSAVNYFIAITCSTNWSMAISVP